MADEKYDLVFRGELEPGAELAQVKQNLSRLFKMDVARIEALFSGKAVVLKRGLDAETAGKYRAAIRKAGARIETPSSQSASPASTTPATPNQVRAQTARSESETSVPVSASPDAAAEVGTLSLAPAGGDILAPGEKQRQPAVDIDTTAFSLRPVGAALLDDGEYEQPVPLPLDLQGLDLAPVGADVLKPEERQAEINVEIDLSGLSVAPPGDRLEAPKGPPPPPPDVSRISLVDDQS
jgi:hypothetical protein